MFSERLMHKSHGIAVAEVIMLYVLNYFYALHM